MSRGCEDGRHCPYRNSESSKRLKELSKTLRIPTRELAATELLTAVIQGMHLEHADQAGFEEYSLVLETNISEALEHFDLFNDPDVETIASEESPEGSGDYMEFPAYMESDFEPDEMI